MNNINFNGTVQLSSKVEKVIREKEFMSLRKYISTLAEDVFVKNREVIESNPKFKGVLFEGILTPSQKPFRKLFKIPKS